MAVTLRLSTEISKQRDNDWPLEINNWKLIDAILAQQFEAILSLPFSHYDPTLILYVVMAGAVKHIFRLIGKF